MVVPAAAIFTVHVVVAVVMMVMAAATVLIVRMVVSAMLVMDVIMSAGAVFAMGGMVMGMHMVGFRLSRKVFLANFPSIIPQQGKPPEKIVGVCPLTDFVG